MLLSLVYLAIPLLLQALVRSGRGDLDREVELLVLRHQLKVVSRGARRPPFRRRDCMLLAASLDQSGDLRGGLLVQAFDLVAIRVQRDRDGGVTESLLDDLRVDTGGEGEARAGMPKIMGSDATKARRPD